MHIKKKSKSIPLTVARVLALACTNEYLLRTMDSLVAVQMIYELKAITKIKTKSKHS